MTDQVDVVPFFTVFTATFNRAHLLPRVYESLRTQVDRDFEWVIVDDGSADNTRDLAEEWIRESDFTIRYHYQPNSGRHVAINRGVSLAKGYLFVSVDSDDWLAPNALHSIKKAWLSIPVTSREYFAGVVGLCASPSGAIVGTRFPQKILDSNAVEIRTKYYVKGDKFGANRVDVLKQYPFPENLGRYVADALVWNRIARRYSLRFVDEVWAYVDYQPGGMSAKDVINRSTSPHAARLYYKEYVSLSPQLHVPAVERLKAYVNFVRFSLHANIPLKSQALESSEKTLWLLSLPIGLTLWARDRWKVLNEK
ncbi:glycosyltransferase family 2 protein [Calidithermus chliarophilus]|uniref:glycosyltransferase family 2 protein n=1 Tax=Calidithermus chliarophilus TaxID=52023 RepID=UPI00146F9594|nr:glycosyltransferase family 2 protein [Calidithermus chliarophilus]